MTIINKLQQIAKTAHSVHLAYCKEVNEKTQPSWENISDKHRSTIINSVTKILLGEINTVEESHENFLKTKKEYGWVYGEKYSVDNKTNPRLVPFEDLKEYDRVKESLFFGCVMSFKDSEYLRRFE